MTFVKVCGITNIEDAELAVRHGADALGFNFYPKSPRFIEPSVARAIIEALPKAILNVGVFVNESLETIVETVSVSGIGAIQLHGEESSEYANSVKAATGLPIIKAFRVSPEFKPEDVLGYDVDAILLDAYSPREHGGTGETFDWEIARKVLEMFPKMYLAGGLGPANVADAVQAVSPYAVDACSGLELTKGRKDSEKVRLFLSRIPR